MAAEDDWRNRSAYCDVWVTLFQYFEHKLLAQGGAPISLHSGRALVERQMLEMWKLGVNLSLQEIVAQKLIQVPAGTRSLERSRET